MIKDALIILRKELKNILKDRRTLIATLLVPFLLMPIIFTGMSFVERKQRSSAEDTIYPVMIMHNEAPEFLDILSGKLNFTLTKEPGDDVLVVEFPEGYIPGDTAKAIIHFNSTSKKSSFAASMISSALVEYSAYLADSYLDDYGIDLQSIYTISVFKLDTAPEEAQGAEFLLVMVPYMILIYVFAGAMAVGIDATAGEKERGSLAVILVNQVSRTSIAIGKILYAVTVGVVSSCMTFCGFILAIKISGGMFGESVNLSGFSFGSLLVILITLVMTSTIAASIIILLGSLAKTAKEASTYILPIYFIVIILGVLTMNMDPSSNQLLFLIPFLNTVFMLKGAIISNSTMLQLVMLIVSDTVLIALLVYSTSRLYNSEKILNTIS
ncbi:MAG: ABC transporter permease [Spirochaetales bacterium]|nr:ABC transporter permease [Spirochaetales bacterium]